MFTSRKSSRGFSLLEVCLALTILVLISGSIYAVLRGSIDTAASLRENQTRSEEVQGFLDLCSRTFHALPGQARLELRIRQEGSMAVPEVIIREAPQLLSWGNVKDMGTVSVLGLKPQIGGRYSLALLRNNPGDSPTSDPVAIAKPEDWLPLVSDVTKVTWRFYEQATNQWLDVLQPGQARPLAVELTLELADEPAPIRVVFQIVPLAANVKTASFSPNNSKRNPNQPNPENSGQTNPGGQNNQGDANPGQNFPSPRGSGPRTGNTSNSPGQPNFIDWNRRPSQ